MLDIKKAFDWVIKYEKNLIKYKNKQPNEEVLNHQLARRIADDQYQTDVGYGVDQMSGKKKGVSELGLAIRPDIIVHKRGSNEDNKIVIECKWDGVRSKVLKDFYKLLYFLLSSTYKYEAAYFINYSSKNLASSKMKILTVSTLADVDSFWENKYKNDNLIVEIELGENISITQEEVLNKLLENLISSSSEYSISIIGSGEFEVQKWGQSGNETYCIYLVGNDIRMSNTRLRYA